MVDDRLFLGQGRWFLMTLLHRSLLRVEAPRPSDIVCRAPSTSLRYVVGPTGDLSGKAVQVMKGGAWNGCVMKALEFVRDRTIGFYDTAIRAGLAIIQRYLRPTRFVEARARAWLLPGEAVSAAGTGAVGSRRSYGCLARARGG